TGAARRVVACGHPAPTAPPQQPIARTADAAIDVTGPPLDQDLPRLAERSVHMMKDLLTAMQAAGTDCGVATQKVTAVADAYLDVTAASSKIAHAGHDRVKQLHEALAPYDAELDATAKLIAQAITASNCAGDAGFSHAFDRLSEGM